MPDAIRFDTPMLGPEMVVAKEWIDYNDHLNMAYYNVIFDRSSDGAFDVLNIGEAHRRAENMTLMTAQAQVNYLRELKLGAKVRATLRLVDADAKRLHIYQELYHSEGWLAATSERIMLHVDLSGTKVAPFSPEVEANIQTMLRYHRSLPPTKYMGKPLGIRRG